MKTLLFTTFLLLSSSSFSYVNKDDEGKGLHDESCIRCHTSSMYMRDNRKDSYAALRQQVSFCSQNFRTGWLLLQPKPEATCPTRPPRYTSNSKEVSGSLVLELLEQPPRQSRGRRLFTGRTLV